jgi:type IV pilus assembly PilX-like protein
MTNTRYSIVGRPGERGSALIGVLLLLMMMSALVAALGVNGRTETLISRNQYSEAQAHAAAEAGLNHAVELATNYILKFKNYDPGGPGVALQLLLTGPFGDSGSPEADADNGSLEAHPNRPGIDDDEDIPHDSRLRIAGFNAWYEASVMDDNESAPGEDSDPYQDRNERLIIQAIGYGPDNTKVVLEALIGPLLLPAIVTNGNLDISDSVSIEGARGSVHSNGDLTIGGTPMVEVKATASGELHAPDHIDGNGGAAELSLFDIRASDYRALADYILTSDGIVRDLSDPTGSSDCTWISGSPCHGGWDFNGASGWGIVGAAPTAGTYYVEGAVTISSSFGSAESPLPMSIIAEKSIEISGSPHITAATSSGLLFVTDADLEISGGLVTVDPDTSDPFVDAGRMLVREQINLSGSPDLAGHIVVENAASVEGFSDNQISGRVRIKYDGSRGFDVYRVIGWRDVR